MTKYIKLDRVKLMKGIMDALVLEEEPRYGDLYLEIIAPDNEIFQALNNSSKEVYALSTMDWRCRYAANLLFTIN